MGQRNFSHVSGLRRVFVAESFSRGEEQLLRLSPEESRHLAKVLRAERGTEVEALDGCGTIWRAEVMDANPREVALRALEETRVAPSVPRYELGVALPKGGRMDDLARQLVELGVARLSPLLTEHSEAGKVAERGAAKMEKWRRIAVEACKQSGNPWLPEIFEPRPFIDWLSSLPAGGVYWLGSPGAHPPGSGGEDEEAENVAVAIGPEGGFSAREEEQAAQAGFLPVGLGPYVLRVETAAVAALAVARARFRA